MISLELATGTNEVIDITSVARDWQRSSRALGGCWEGMFTAQGLARADMVRWFEQCLGYGVTERYCGLVTWHGYIYEMRLRLDGVEYLRSLAPQQWHNRVKVRYSVSGAQQATAWAENIDSMAAYGTMDYVLDIGEATAAQAQALQARHLEHYAWPATRVVSPIEPGRVGGLGDSLQVVCAGWWSRLNWRVYETTVSATATSAISTLVGACDFVTVGVVDQNDLAVKVDCSTPRRIGDAVEEIVALGDADGHLWNCGVWRDHQLEYRHGDATATYWLRRGQLLYAGGGPVPPPLVEPGRWAFVYDAPVGLQPSPQAGLYDDPRYCFLEEVRFAVPDRLVVVPYGESLSVDMLAHQLGR